MHILLLSQKDRRSSVTFLHRRGNIKFIVTHVKNVIQTKLEELRTHLHAKLRQTYFVTSAMCMCRNCIQSSSSSSNNTSRSCAFPMPVVWYLQRKNKLRVGNVASEPRWREYLTTHLKQVSDSLIDVLIDLQQVIGHSLQGQLMQNWWDGVETTINYQQLGSCFICTLNGFKWNW